MNKIYNILDYPNIIELTNVIKKDFLDNCEFIVIKNNFLLNEEKEIMKYYNQMNNLLGKIQLVDKSKYRDTDQDDFWVDIEYKVDSKNTEPWKSNDQLKLHTDNTLSNDDNFANITELVCIKASKYSGETVIISNNKLIELVKFLDEINKTDLYNELLKTNIYHKSIKKKICIKNENTYTFNFNITQISNSQLNNEENINICKDFSNLLENIMKSSLLNEIRLEKGDALLFNDTIVMHGRKHVFGERFYKKCSILIKN
jgi:hypothetical protein